MACIAPMIAAAPPMSDFIVSIDFGGFSDSPPESNVMPLPTKTTVCRRGLRRGVLQPDQPRRVHRALADAQDAAVAVLAQRLLVQHLDAQPGGGRDPFRLLGQRRGHQVGRCGVDQVADQRHRVGQRLGARGAAPVASSGVSTVSADGGAAAGR